jgi:hypothetical protein
MPLAVFCISQMVMPKKVDRIRKLAMALQLHGAYRTGPTSTIMVSSRPEKSDEFGGDKIRGFVDSVKSMGFSSTFYLVGGGIKKDWWLSPRAITAVKPWLKSDGGMWDVKRLADLVLIAKRKGHPEEESENIGEWLKMSLGISDQKIEDALLLAKEDMGQHETEKDIKDKKKAKLRSKRAARRDDRMKTGATWEKDGKDVAAGSSGNIVWPTQTSR